MPIVELFKRMDEEKMSANDAAKTSVMASDGQKLARKLMTNSLI